MRISSIAFYGITVAVPLVMLYFVIDWALSSINQVAGVLAK